MILDTDQLRGAQKHKKEEEITELMNNKNVNKEMKMNKKRKKRKNESTKESNESGKKTKVEGTKNIIKEDNVQNGNKEDSENEDKPEVEVSKEESNKFNGKFLRNSFNSAAGFTTLQKFITICNRDDKRDLAAEYLQAGGSLLEILRLLDTSEKKNVHNAATVFAAMHIVLMKILAQYPQSQSSAEEACRHLINTHLASVHSMLATQSRAKHRKIVLKLLAAVVSLGGTLPRELLNHLSLHAQLVDVLVSHSKPTDPQSVRTCFIHFILAFLVDGNTSDIRALLEKRGVLSSIFSGMVYDYSNVVQLVLTTVKKYVLENPIISKTLKLHVFSTPIVQALVNLYNWKGPKHWPAFKRAASEHVDLDEKEVTVNCLHDFLITLLTSNRYGIVFHDRSLGTESGPKHNQLINTILQSLDKPWEHEKPSDLVIKILKACPDLIKSQLIYTEPFLVPRSCKKWTAVIQFVSKIISNIDVDSCFKLCSTNMTALQISNAILNFTLPQIVMKSAVAPSLKHNSIYVHHQIIKLLSSIMKKLEEFIAAYRNLKVDNTEFNCFKNSILENILKFMPNLESILNVWAKAFIQDSETISDRDEKDLCVEMKDHLLSILDLLQYYNDICPEMFMTNNIASLENKPQILLTSLNNVENIGEKELTMMKVKALKILLAFNISDFSPNEEIFSTALSFLASKVGNDDNLLDTEVRRTMYLLLNGCEIFEGYNDQIEIWIDGISYLKNDDDRVDVANWIAKIIKRITKHSEKYVSLIYKTEEDTGEEITDVQESIFDELSERNIDDVKSVFPMLPVTSLSPMVYGTIENLKKQSSKALEIYMSIVLTHISHCQISLKTFVTLTEELNLPVKQYVLGWSNKSPTILKKPFSSKSIFSIISEILLSQDINYVLDVKESQFCLQIDSNAMNFTLTKFELRALFRMVIFYLAQTLQNSNKKLKNIDDYLKILSSLLKIANDVEIKSDDLIKDCIKWIFKHPVLLQYFKGIYRKESDAVITHLFIEICTIFSTFQKQTLITPLLQPYVEKFITQVKSAVKKNKTDDAQKEMKVHKELIEHLQLDIKTTAGLLSDIMSLSKDKFLLVDKSTLSSWGRLIPNLIEQFCRREIVHELSSYTTINENLLKKLFNYLIELKHQCKQETDVWENCLYHYLIKFPHNISAIDERILIALIKSNLTLTTVRMLTLIVERSTKLLTAFTKYAKCNDEVFQEKSLVVSILSSNLKYKWDPEFLQKICKFYKSEVLLSLTEPANNDLGWIKDYADAVAYIIETDFDPKTCKETCDIILSNGNKLDAVKEEHVKLYFHLFKKSIEVHPDALKNYVQLLIHVTVTALKKDSKNIAKLDFLCKTLIESINLLKMNKDFSFEELNKNNFWPQFTRINLKSGLKITKEESQKNSLLKALVVSCNVAYKDNSGEEYVKTIFEMTTSHSEFINIMLSNSTVKDDLAELLWTLIKKNHSVMVATHIPLYLASYNATLSTSDQFILKILHCYESNGIKLTGYQPYLWGSAAAIHYSVKGETDTALWRQPSTSQVLDLLTPEIVANSIKNFPIERDLKCDSSSLYSTSGDEQVYDPAFYLPVFTHLLAENNLVACHKVVHSGALALAIIACSSTCEQTRLSAFTVISRYYFHLEATSSKEKLLWINFIETIRNGIAKTEQPLREIRMNSFVAVFLARACLVLTQPLNRLYSPLTTFLMAKPALDLNTIPELLQLCHSSEIEHQSHRYWIFEVIRDGLKIENDMDVALKCVIFKMLLDFYNSVLSDRLSKSLILQIIKSATKMSKSCMILLSGYALLPWLISSIDKFSCGDVLFINYSIDIADNVLEAIHETRSKDAHYYLMLMKMLVRLKSYFNHNLTSEYFKSYVKVLNKTITNSLACNFLTKNDVKDIIDYSKQFLGDVGDYELMLQYGCKFVKKINVHSNSNLSLQETLHKLIMDWLSHTKNTK